jgi:uncharacterized protein (UPF0335 family)
MTIVSSSDGNRPVKAIRQIVEIGAGIEVEGFMLPDGSYRLSKTSAALAIGKPRNSVVVTLPRKTPEALVLKGQFDVVKVRVEGNNRPIDAISLETAALYWQYWAAKGNVHAIAIVTASTTEVLIRRFDEIFEVNRTESEYKKLWEKAYQELLEFGRTYREQLATDLKSELERVDDWIAVEKRAHAHQPKNPAFLEVLEKLEQEKQESSLENQLELDGYEYLEAQVGKFVAGRISKEELNERIDDYRRLSTSNGFDWKAYSEVMKIRRLPDPR